jgi:hypothetical protein
MERQRALGVKRRVLYTLDKETLAWIKRHEEEQIEKKGNWSDLPVPRASGQTGEETAKASPSKPPKHALERSEGTVKTKMVKDRKWRFITVDY